MNRNSFLKKLSLTFMILAFAGGDCGAYVGDWAGFTDVRRTTALQEYNGFLYAGTLGGIRKINPVNYSETVFTNLDGLVDVGIAGLAVTSDHKLWAASKEGYLYELQGKRWLVYGRGYKSMEWKINHGAVISAGSYLVLGTTKGLSFFDLRSKVAAVNISKFSRENVDSVFSLLRSGDTLFVGTEKGIYKTAVDWENVTSNKAKSNIYDPQAWIRVVLASPLAKRTLDSLEIIDSPIDSIDPLIDSLLPDTLEGNPDNPFEDTVDSDTVYENNDPEPDTGSNSYTDSSKSEEFATKSHYNHLSLRNGVLEAADQGVTLSAPYYVRAVRNEALLVDGRSYSQWKSLEVASFAGGKLFLGDNSGIFEFRNGDLHLIPPKSGYPATPLVNIAASRAGVFSNTTDLIHKLNGKDWLPVPGGQFPLADEIVGNELRTLVADDNGDIYLGTWGQGIIRFRNGQQTHWNSTNTCMEGVVGVGTNSYIVVNSISDVFGESIWFTLLKGGGEGKEARIYHLGHLNTRTGEVKCFNDVGYSNRNHGLEVISDSTLVVAGNYELTLYHFNMSGGQPGSVTSKKIKLPGGFERAWDATGDSHGRLWVTMGDKLGYIDSIDQVETLDTREVKILENFTGITCQTLETDTLENVWAGCDNGLFHIEPAAQAEDAIIERYTIEDGLLSNIIFDLSVQKSTGHVWVATESGISLFESAGRKSKPNLKELAVYPNPFRARHRMVIFDHLAGGTSLRVFNQSGHVVRYFPPSAMKGSQFQWDGTNQDGRKVKPGIYLYSLDSDNSSQRGKLIVAR